MRNQSKKPPQLPLKLRKKKRNQLKKLKMRPNQSRKRLL
jgi:hypothetical protein